MTNKRTLKNVIMVALVVLFAGASVLTMTFMNGGAQKEMRPQFSQSDNSGGPPGMNGSDNSGSSDNNSGSSDNQQTPPQMPNQNGSSNQDNNSQNNQSDNQNNQNSQDADNWSSFDNDNNQNGSDNNSDNSGNNQQTPPQMPDNQNGGSDNSDNNSQSPPDMQGNDNSDNNQGNNNRGFGGGNGFQNGGGPSQGGFRSGESWLRTAVKYSIFTFDSLAAAALVMYLIMSRFNKKGFRETLRGASNIVIYILCVLIIAGSLTGLQIVASNTVLSGTQAAAQLPDSQSNNSQNAQGGFQPDNNSSESVDAAGATTVEDEKTLSESYKSETADESAILVQNGGNATIDGAKVTKSGDSSNTENSEFYGVNAGILVKSGSTATIKDADITTSAKGANAVFSTGENSKIYVSDTTIKTTGSSSARGLDATYGGYIEADNVTITTQGGSCATLATDRGEGTVKVKNSKLTTAGAGSPLIYSTGDISVTDTEGSANGAQIAVVEGKNSATVTSSDLTCSAAGNRGDVDIAGVMIYQSMSGDADTGTGNFTATDSTLSIQKDSDYYKSAPMFFVTNTDAVITLENTKLSYGSGTLLSAKGTSEWGTSGSNGGNVTLKATKQTLTGDIELDKLSTLDMSLKSSTYKGTINGDNTAKSVKLTLDKSSKITLTGDSYVTELSNAVSDNSNIDFNGYKLYVNGKAVN